jgi:hypothetical protein
MRVTQPFLLQSTLAQEHSNLPYLDLNFPSFRSFFPLRWETELWRDSHVRATLLISSESRIPFVPTITGSL